MSVTVIVNAAALERHVRAESSKYVERIGQQMVPIARNEIASRKQYPLNLSGARQSRTSPNLEDSLTSYLTQESSGPVVHVGTRGQGIGYAVWVHEGTPPHPIRARTPNGMVFYWRRARGVVRVQQVKHPGGRANPYLRVAAEKVPK